MGRMLENPPEILGLPAGIVFFIIGLISMAIGYVLDPPHRRHQGVI